MSMRFGIPRDAVQIFLDLGEQIPIIDTKKDAEKVDLPARTIYHHQQMIRKLKKAGKKFNPMKLQKAVRDKYIKFLSNSL